MNRGRHLHSAVHRQGILGGFVSSVRAKFGQGGAHSWRPKHVRTEEGRIRRFRSPIVLFVCAFVFASGSAAFAYTTIRGSGTGQAQAVALKPPGAGNASNPTTTSLSLSWAASPNVPSGGGYLVLRSTSSGGPYSKISSGTCQQSTTVVSEATSCTDTGLTLGTTYYYEVEAAFYDISTLWVSTPDSQFSGSTGQGGQGGQGGQAGQAGQAPSITSTDKTTFVAGSPGTFTVTTSGFSAPALTDTGFSGCTASILPHTVSFVDDHDGTATLAGTPPATSSGTYTVCIKAADDTNTATQSFTLTVLPASAITKSAPAITSANSASFFAGSAGSFQATATGSPAPTFSNTAFSGCTPSTLPTGVTLSSNGLLSGTPGAGAAGTFTLCINAANGVSPNGTQRFTLTIESETLVIGSTAVSGAASSTPDLGPITVRRQTGSGIPITTGGALLVNLTSSPASGATFGTTQFASAPASVTIPSGQSTATFWYGLTTTGRPTITVSATNYGSGTQVETITAAPAGLGITLATGSTGSPLISCGSPSASYTCNVTGVGTAGRVAFSVTFWSSSKGPVVYSATQPSTISETGHGSGSVTINANASGSSPGALTASLGASTLSFGPYTLTINVTS